MRPVVRFAAHLARLLNAGTEVWEVDLRLLRTLAGREYASLIGMGVVGGGPSAEELAQKYFDAVLRRRLWLVRNNHTHKGHALLEALCRRGLDLQWPAARLGRGSDAGPGRAVGQPADFADVARRLAEVDNAVAPGNPAARTQERYGPLNLLAGAGRAEVAEELSLWDAIACAPVQRRPLAKGEAFNAFCSLVIKAVEAANDTYGAYVTLGLSPSDWAGALSVNTATKASAFRTEVLKEGPDALHDPDAWRRAWTRRQVPGYRSADELWHSELGRALRGLLRGGPLRTEPLDGPSDPAGADPEPEFMDETEFRKYLELARAAGIVDEFNVWLFGEVWAEEEIAELAQRPEVRSRLAGADELAAYVDELTERVSDWVRRLLDGEDDGGDDDDDPEPSR